MSKKKQTKKEPMDEQHVTTDDEAVTSEEESISVESQDEKQCDELEEITSKYYRAVADYRNLEQRIMKERREIVDRCRQEVISSFLPVLDNLNKAEMFITDPGLKMIMDQFKQTLEMNGVRELDLIGKQFDPHAAECIEVVDGDEDGVITEVVRKAYELNGKVIQHGQVKVSQKAKE